ncbi:MAG TPA: sigma-70 family RNA polymerase sigma factor [Bryobacteraceae bacterium]|jgi:RNA polymerase sigma factor (TIGR02999 family)
MSVEADKVTALLHDWQAGRQQALDELMPLVYDQIRTLAQHHLRREKPGHTLRATELVHEAYLKLVGSDVSFTGRAHFYALASRVIRHILINHGNAKHSAKRGGGAARLALDEALQLGADPPDDSIVEVHEALERLEALDPRKAKIVEMIFFGGLEQDMAAEALSISPATLRRELRLAKAWLFRELQQPAAVP